MKTFIVFLFVALTLIQSAQMASAVELQDIEPQGKFIDLFTKGKYDIRGPATNYIKACCEKRDEAIALLRDNGFELTIVSDPEKVIELNKHWDSTDKNYDEFISGSRGPSIWRFWDILSTYRVTVFIKNEKVDWVWARVDRTMP